MKTSEIQSRTDAVQQWLDGDIRTVHLMGICGVGMAGLAVLLNARGLVVTGCDAAMGPLAGWLQKKGISVAGTHDVAHLDPRPDGVIRSPAVALESAEVQAALSMGLPVFRRGEMLPALLRGSLSVAVCGTHGKTTTSSFIAQLLQTAGRNPGWCIGGETAALGGVANPGVGNVMVVEADESDGTLVHYRADIGVITNIEFDHMEHFESEDAFAASFATFARQSQSLVTNADDPRAAAMGRAVDSAATFGFGESAAIRATEIETAGRGQTFTVWRQGESLGRWSLPLPGRHNVANVLAAIAVVDMLGLDSETVREGVAKLELPRRRFDGVADAHGIRVISDYAHHPSEIRALIAAAQSQPHDRLLAVFQPHRYTRTLALGPTFPAAFKGVDQLMLVPVYAASERPTKGAQSWDLYAHFRDAEGVPLPQVASSLPIAWAAIRQQLQPGDLLLVIGAGDVERIAAWAAADLSGSSWPPQQLTPAPSPWSQASVVRLNEPLADKTTFRLGGTADIWMDVASEDDFAAVLRWTSAQAIPFRLLASGSNVLVSDLGVRGVVARLTGDAFRAIRRQGDSVTVGAGVLLVQLLDWMESQSLEGFEFIEGIPGSLGGGLQMNAGAWGQCLGDHLISMRCLTQVGEIVTVLAEGLNLGYRRCDFLSDHYVVEATFRCHQGRADAIAAQRETIREKRAWMNGFRSAGSFFKNPDGDYAGRLLEAIGMHGRRVGGAQVGTHHANFVTAVDGATAADVMALMMAGRQDVRDTFAIELEPEVKYWE
ncbi:MAG: UDP-N-acetylmuramate--L-alanine ligase [Verrucomicrobia bacterium]|nr:UDP-N-acetylmuramate--L-alanine ligase [Verrucomicrobiota bacterium]